MTSACLFLMLSILPSETPELAARHLFMDAFVTHWREADAEALAGLWEEGGNWMNLTGSRRVVRGRDRLEEVWSVGLQGRQTEQSRSLTISIDAVEALAPELAQVDMVMSFGHARTGIIREAMVAVIRKGEDGWRIRSSRVARISSTPAER